MTKSIRHRARTRHSAGFSLLELLVVMAILGLLMAGVLTVFDTSNRLASVQSQVTDMQQSLRIGHAEIARYSRMAGRGGLPANRPLAVAPWLQGLAFDVRNNVGTGAPVVRDDIAMNYPGSPRAIIGTDILTVRGCFDTMFVVRSTSGADFTKAADNTVGTLILFRTAHEDYSQDLEPLDGSTGRALVMVSPENEAIYTVAEITAAVPDQMPDPNQVTLNLNLSTSAFLSLAGGVYNDKLNSVEWACLLEEYRYYIRQEIYDNPNLPPGSPQLLSPKLSRAMMRPGYETPFGDDPQNLSLDVADNLIDLQVSIAFDSDYPSVAPAVAGSFTDDADFIGNDDIVFEGVDAVTRATDDWLFNEAGDDISAVQWRQHRFPGNTWPVGMQYVRVSLIARTDQRDGKYQAPLFGQIEDHDYQAPPAGAPDFNSADHRKYRRRLVQAVLDSRNL